MRSPDSNSLAIKVKYSFYSENPIEFWSPWVLLARRTRRRTGPLVAYANRDEQASEYPRRMHWLPDWCDTLMHQVNYLFPQGHEHKYAYDGKTLALILERAGFVQVNHRDFDPALDSESRRIGSLYMKARKPDSFQAA